jgi:hypothetical protein
VEHVGDEVSVCGCGCECGCGCGYGCDRIPTCAPKSSIVNHYHQLQLGVILPSGLVFQRFLSKFDTHDTVTTRY